jgi:hypothetical protein
MPKTFCAPPLCMRYKFDTTAAALQFSLGPQVVTGAAVNNLPEFADYNKQFQKLKADLVKPVDFNCDDDCRCVKFSKDPVIKNSPVPHVLNEWQTPDGKTVKWEVTGLTADIWMGNCLPAGSEVKIGNGPWQQVKDAAPSTGFGPASTGGGGHKGGKKKKKAKRAKRRR